MLADGRMPGIHPERTVLHDHAPYPACRDRKPDRHAAVRADHLRPAPRSAERRADAGMDRQERPKFAFRPRSRTRRRPFRGGDRPVRAPGHARRRVLRPRPERDRCPRCRDPRDLRTEPDHCRARFVARRRAAQCRDASLFGGRKLAQHLAAGRQRRCARPLVWTRRAHRRLRPRRQQSMGRFLTPRAQTRRSAGREWRAYPARQKSGSAAQRSRRADRRIAIVGRGVRPSPGAQSRASDRKPFRYPRDRAQRPQPLRRATRRAQGQRRRDRDQRFQPLSP
ncbi:hypothetical protein D9M73_152720 [compost metagenome]